MSAHVAINPNNLLNTCASSVKGPATCGEELVWVSTLSMLLLLLILRIGSLITSDVQSLLRYQLPFYGLYGFIEIKLSLTESLVLGYTIGGGTLGC